MYCKPRFICMSVRILLFLLCYNTLLFANSWHYSDLKGLDKWGDCNDAWADLIAVYGQQTSGGWSFRADLMNLTEDAEALFYIGIDFTEGGKDYFSPDYPQVTDEIEWDLLIRFSSDGNSTLLDTAFQDLSSNILHSGMDTKLDYLYMEIDSSLFPNPDANWQIQAVTLDALGKNLYDKTKVFSSQDTTGRGKVVLIVSNVFTGYGPHVVSWYDGFAIRAGERPGERRGFKYLLDAFETHQVPMVLGDMRIETFPANEYLEINDRIRQLSNQNLCDVLSTLTYGHFMCWQPDDVDSKAIEMMHQLREGLDLPASDIFFPYESMITSGDIKTIADAGFPAIFGLDQYRYWFGWIEDWSNMDAVREDIESLRKIHRINNMDFFFNTQINNYQGFAADERWEVIDWNTWSEYAMYEGTDEGLYMWWRRILHDMAMDEDQEQFFTIGTDLLLTPWLFPDVIEWNIGWIAAHPWIEAITFSDLLNRNWEVIDHGDLGLDDNDLLIQYPLQGDIHYNAYFPWFYHGGVSDGHSPNIPVGAIIESYSDHVPYLRDGERIPSGKIMGDDSTANSLVDETLSTLRSLPDNAITDLAWLAWFLATAEQTFHAQTDYAGGVDTGSDWGGQYLHPGPKLRANYVNQINKLAAAAFWADSAHMELLPEISQLRKQDYDLDGEDEFVLFNDRLWCLFENDGGRLEYVFSFSDTTGPVQVVAPTHEHQLIFDGLGRNFEQGEISALPAWDRAADGCFVEDFTYPEYTLSIDDNRLMMTSPDNSIRKTLTLEGGQIHGDYQLSGISQVNPGFGFTINLMNTYNPGWSALYQKIETDETYGWQCLAGGCVTVDLSDPNVALASMNAFSDSPADEEMQERLDYTGYPNGHWFNFPYHTISTIGLDSFRITLSFGADSVTSVHLSKSNPEQLAFFENWPNPFNAETQIRFYLEKSGFVNITVYNILGERIVTILSDFKHKGEHLIHWRAETLPGGVYLCRLQTKSCQKTIKLLINH